MKKENNSILVSVALFTEKNPGIERNLRRFDISFKLFIWLSTTSNATPYAFIVEGHKDGGK